MKKHVVYVVLEYYSIYLPEELEWRFVQTSREPLLLHVVDFLLTKNKTQKMWNTMKILSFAGLYLKLSTCLMNGTQSLIAFVKDETSGHRRAINGKNRTILQVS